jgi:dCTP deaminase
VILTGPEIHRMVKTGEIVIEPYDPASLEPNSYGFHLGNRIAVYDDEIIDVRRSLTAHEYEIGSEGFLFEPGRFYLGHTAERFGGVNFASEIYANLSTALCGTFIQTSAPLGHSGAVIHWTLEITVVHPVRLYAGIRIGKVCFWKNYGKTESYTGRYAGSRSVVTSRIFEDGGPT